MKVTYSDRIIFMTIFLEEETYEGEVLALPILSVDERHGC